MMPSKTSQKKRVTLAVFIFSCLALLLFYFFIVLERDRVSTVKGGSIKAGFDFKNGTFNVGVELPEAQLNHDSAISTTKLIVTDKETGAKLISFEIDLVPGKYRWVCNDYIKLRNYLDGKDYVCNDVLLKYFSEKLQYAKSDSRKLEGLLSVGMASQEGLTNEQELLSDKRATTLYNEVNEYLDSIKLNVPTLKVSFGKYLGSSSDKCTERTEEQRIVAFIRVYDSNISINDSTYDSFKSMFYNVCGEAFRNNKIQLNGLEYSKYQQQKIFLERRFL